MRVIDVFADRGIYPSHIVEEMRAALGNFINMQLIYNLEKFLTFTNFLFDEL